MAMMLQKQNLIFQAADSDLSAKLWRPDSAKALYLFGHGAGAGMDHSFMETLSQQLFDRQIATLRYQFPYMQAGRRRPDSKKRLEETVRRAIAFAKKSAPDLPLFVGGKSMGGRISSQTVAQDGAAGIAGLIFVGFPLHAPGKASDKRGEHLSDVSCAMLFLQGTRDALATLKLIEPLCASLPSAILHIVEGADHSFKVLKRSGRTLDDVFDELCTAICRFVSK